MIAPNNLTQVRKALEASSKEWAEHAPMVTRAVLERNLGLTIDDVQADRIEAMKEVVRADRVLSDPQLFETCARALAGRETAFGLLEGMEPDDLALGVAWIKRLRKAEPEYGRAVRAYAAACLVESELHCPSPRVGFGPFAAEVRALSPVSRGDREEVERRLGRLLVGDPADFEARLDAVVGTEYDFYDEQLALLGVCYVRLRDARLI